MPQVGIAPVVAETRIGALNAMIWRVSEKPAPAGDMVLYWGSGDAPLDEPKAMFRGQALTGSKESWWSMVPSRRVQQEAAKAA